ncbi:histidine kinase [Algoriphagus sp. SE2]|uniref:sensor histidine kinase n=1 Tax=Algoriphagus sp. SE2 TaxID=3141536 RepID=UPI0031CCFEFF
MKSKSLVFRDIEWWSVTFVFLIIIITNILMGMGNGYHDMMRFFGKVAMPIIVYLGFYLMHLVIIPKYLRDKNVLHLILFSVLTTAIMGALSGLAASAIGNVHTQFFRFFFSVIALYPGYLLTAILIKRIFYPPAFNDFQIYNGLRLIMVFVFISIFLFISQIFVNDVVLVVILMIVPGVLLVVLYNYFLLYKNKLAGKIKPYRWYLWCLFGFIILLFIIISAENNVPEIILFGFGLIALLFFVIFPLSELVFRKYDSVIGKIDTLSVQVNQSSANLSFLRSQINPHFLFNALNTLYGTALIENAEKTSDGIQKLGDMMRFMLHENQMDKIPLSREIDYLRNYLDLQMLRFAKEDHLDVSIQIAEEYCQGDISPMLLIPFVENAFKHGISTKSKSWIKINLRCLKGSVHLDVVNSMHPKKVTEDPKDESGIGLENVKSRLAHFYPQKHNLTIVANDTEHFVHLSVQLQ